MNKIAQELRSRINPLYAKQIGTESNERLVSAEEIDRLENEALAATVRMDNDAMEIDELRAELEKIKSPCAQPVPEGAQIDAMVNKFLQWKLPADFGPDCYISFDVIKALQWSWPTGTNLFTATQARQMIEAMLESANDRPKETK